MNQPIDAEILGETTQITIDQVGARGDGVAHGPVYAPFTLPGERVLARISGERAEVVEVLTPSPERVAPQCAHFGECGGCALQHWAREPYREWKRDLVGAALMRAGVPGRPAPVIDATGSGRRRATFHAVRAKAVGFVFGFSRRASHAVFDMTECPVLSARLDAARPGLRRLAERLLPKAGRVDVHATETDAGLDVDVRGGSAKDDAALRGALCALAEEGDWARLSWGGETVAARRPPAARIGKASVTLAPGAFLQATRDGEAALAAIAMRACEDAKTVADLYCGLGAFALRLAERANVHAVEGHAPSVAALKRAAAGAQGLKTVSAVTRDLARQPLGRKELARFDAVVIDPPRAGAAGQCAALAEADVASVVYVSCNPATFARDAATLCAAGYRLEMVAPVDQFLWSAHVELAGVFRR